MRLPINDRQQAMMKLIRTFLDPRRLGIFPRDLIAIERKIAITLQYAFTTH